jgi:hypothetical protein
MPAWCFFDYNQPLLIAARPGNGSADRVADRTGAMRMGNARHRHQNAATRLPPAGPPEAYTEIFAADYVSNIRRRRPGTSPREIKPSRCTSAFLCFSCYDSAAALSALSKCDERHGAAGPGTIVKYLRCTTSGAAGNGLGTTCDKQRAALRSSICDAK